MGDMNKSINPVDIISNATRAVRVLHEAICAVRAVAGAAVPAISCFSQAIVGPTRDFDIAARADTIAAHRRCSHIAIRIDVAIADAADTVADVVETGCATTLVAVSQKNFTVDVNVVRAKNSADAATRAVVRADADAGAAMTAMGFDAIHTAHESIRAVRAAIDGNYVSAANAIATAIAVRAISRAADAVARVVAAAAKAAVAARAAFDAGDNVDAIHRAAHEAKAAVAIVENVVETVGKSVNSDEAVFRAVVKVVELAVRANAAANAASRATDNVARARAAVVEAEVNAAAAADNAAAAVVKADAAVASAIQIASTACGETADATRVSAINSPLHAN